MRRARADGRDNDRDVTSEPPSGESEGTMCARPLNEEYSAPSYLPVLAHSQATSRTPSVPVHTGTLRRSRENCEAARESRRVGSPLERPSQMVAGLAAQAVRRTVAGGGGLGGGQERWPGMVGRLEHRM